jgi:radical SAM-linked protein
MSALKPELKPLLHGIEKPGRYVGGEYGLRLKEGPGLLRVAICYPDLYEIGMSNLAVRLIYRLLNSLDGVACERVFAPALDFEAALRARHLPLYSLESFRPLREFDLLGFSVGYELTFTNLLNVLDLGGISLRAAERGRGEPLVIAGGPAVTNPVPFGAFLDAVFIGEFEGEAVGLFQELARMKESGAGRSDLLARITRAPYVWAETKNGPVRRAHWSGFGDGGGGAAGSGYGLSADSGAEPGGTAPFPVPSIRTVQDHGVVEIMRGCPNGCRFCHAAIFYRPFRLKEPEAIAREVQAQVQACGYREITLSSLSSGDFPGISTLVRSLNRRFQRQRVSFALPSLRIDSLALELLSELSAVRKSGLTFAVEAPSAEWQRGINKPASLERTVQILLEARERGWRSAKFYFMIGLPVAEGRDESGPIVEFLSEVERRTRMSLTANVSAFIPKPHTPFQWSAQLTESAALEGIRAVKRGLAGRGIKVRYHSPFLSLLEGIISRGDGRVGELVLQGFLRGARFDAWEDRILGEVWREVLASAGWPVEEETCRERQLQEPLPWSGVRLGVGERYLKEELARARAGELTAACCAECSQPCGACGGGVRPRDSIRELPDAAPEPEPPASSQRVLFSFSKSGSAAFLGHLDLLGIFERSLLRAGCLTAFTEGFNPKPRLEFAHPLALGVESREEIALVELKGFSGAEDFLRRMNGALPEGLQLERVRTLPAYQPGAKKLSVMALFWGADYRVSGGGARELARDLEAASASSPHPWRLESVSDTDLVLRVPFGAKPGSILRILEASGVKDPGSQGLAILRLNTWAAGADSSPVSYFEVKL